MWRWPLVVMLAAVAGPLVFCVVFGFLCMVIAGVWVLCSVVM